MAKKSKKEINPFEPLDLLNAGIDDLYEVYDSKTNKTIAIVKGSIKAYEMMWDGHSLFSSSLNNNRMRKIDTPAARLLYGKKTK